MLFEQFYKLLFKQLENFYFINQLEYSLINEYSSCINKRFLFNCSNLQNKYYSNIEICNPYHSCQYLMFLYFCANTIFKNKGRLEICDKIYNLSKLISASDIYYEIDLPKIFFFDHPVGTVLGRAKYNDYFQFSQGCTIGNNKGNYPILGKFVSMKSNSKILGKCNIGNNVIVAANTYIKDTDIPDNSIVFGTDRNLIIKNISPENIDSYFNEIFKKIT